MLARDYVTSFLRLALPHTPLRLIGVSEAFQATMTELTPELQLARFGEQG